MTAPWPPPNHLVPAILTTILCCLPFGIVSLVYANRVNSKYQIGDYVGALESSSKAKTWWVVAIVAAAVVALAYLIFVVAIFSSASS